MTYNETDVRIVQSSRERSLSEIMEQNTIEGSEIITPPFPLRDQLELLMKIVRNDKKEPQLPHFLPSGINNFTP